MSALFLVLALYLLPRFIADPAEIGRFALLLAFGLVVDVAANFVRFKRPTCAVSAAVTAAMLFTLSPGVPVWGEMMGVAAALILGKHVWGGTGKNPLNPAMVGLLLLGLLFRMEYPVFVPSVFLTIAILLSLPFLLIRPFAAIGMMAGMAAGLLIFKELSWANYVSYGVVLWSCLVITDPVTTTANPPAGFLIGLLAGFLPMTAGGSIIWITTGVLVSNMLSSLVERFDNSAKWAFTLTFGKNQKIPFSEDSVVHDLAGETAQGTIESDLSCEEILERMERNNVFGMGGAAFPTARKIRTVMGSNALQKHLIVNGVECDPGLIHDKWLLREHADEIMQGIRSISQCVQFNSITVATKDVPGMKFAEPVKLHQVKDYYPAGAEKTLIQDVLNIKLDEGTIPAANGILVLNTQTFFAIYEAVCLNRKADTRFLTVANVGNHSGSVVRVRLGAKVKDVMNAVAPGAAAVFTGGGMMNARLADPDAVVDEKANFIAASQYPNYKESKLCSRCGRCSAVCPARLKVHAIADLVDEDKIGKTVRFHPERCMECGSCSYVCLAGRHLAARVSAAKKQMNR